MTIEQLELERFATTPCIAGNEASANMWTHASVLEHRCSEAQLD